MPLVGSNDVSMTAIREEIARAKRDARAQAKACGVESITFGDPRLAPLPYGLRLIVPFTIDGVAQQFTVAI